ncbi:hypothetical protein L596_003904 [Steinernema carpocapsae]|uniref:Homeobox domain-containing protein n=1 Tax=Steinernema carpocapsae TaxID=34508 RepID=A0A4U8UU38_STECR|nr:hypothetical protein L596_003904 [Steinernema carpocapsae]
MSRDDRSAFSISHLLQSSPSTPAHGLPDPAVTQLKPSAPTLVPFSVTSCSPNPSDPQSSADSSAPLPPLSSQSFERFKTNDSSSSRTSPEVHEAPEMNHPGPFNSPQWYNAVSYVNMATQQISQHLANSAAAQSPLIGGGWDPRIPWIYPYMHKTQQKRKGGQIRFTNEQTDALEQKFDNHKYLSPQERKKLAKSLQLSERQNEWDSENDLQEHVERVVNTRFSLE